ncbi:MAG: glycosyltransferase family 4 protein [Candidatus Hydrothermarchaeales archaeon]
MEVLVISTWKPRKGGIVTHVENLTKRSRNEFLILTYADRDEKDEADVLRVPYINLPVLRGISFALFGFFKARKEEFDIIHAHYAIPQGFAGALLKKFRKKPLILTVHGSDLTILGASPLMRPILRWVLRSCDRIIAVSKYMKGMLKEFGVEEEKIRVIHNGVDIQPSPRGKERRIVFIGALVKQKGVDVLIRAFKKVKGKHEDLKLLIVGDGPEREKLETFATKLGLADVEFKGYVEDPNPVFSTQSVLVLPSRIEGFGIVALEAMARGVPVIASKTGGIVEIVTHEENGLLFEKENHMTLARSLTEIFMDEKLRDKLVKNGKERVKDFTWKKVVEETEDVYGEVAG